MKKAVRIVFFVMTAVAAALFILSVSIGLPVWQRGFYYSRVDALEIPETSGESRETVIAAYDELLDSLTENGEFGTGVFTCSDSAKEHFEDCRKLFMLDTVVFSLSALWLSVYAVLRGTGNRVLMTVRGLRPTFFGAAAAVIPVVFFGVFLAVDLDAAYRFFHTLLFYGKSNWLFDVVRDGVLAILPQRFFIECGILIGAADIFLSIATASVCLILRRKKEDRKAV